MKGLNTAISAVLSCIIILWFVASEAKAKSAETCKNANANSLPTPIQKQSLCTVFNKGLGYCQIKFTSVSKLKYDENAQWLKQDTESDYTFKSQAPEIVEMPSFEFQFEGQSFRCWAEKNSSTHKRAKARFKACQQGSPDFFFFSWNEQNQCVGIY